MRSQFNDVTRNAFFSAESEDAKHLAEETKTRYAGILAQQQDGSFLKEHSMPQVKKDANYCAPKVQCHGSGPRHENAFVITNTEHSKTTNNGYKRGNACNFFCH